MEYLVGGNGVVDFEPSGTDPCNCFGNVDAGCRCVAECAILTCGDGGWFPCQCVHGG